MPLAGIIKDRLSVQTLNNYGGNWKNFQFWSLFFQNFPQTQSGSLAKTAKRGGGLFEFVVCTTHDPRLQLYLTSPLLAKRFPSVIGRVFTIYQPKIENKTIACSGASLVVGTKQLIIQEPLWLRELADSPFHTEKRTSGSSKVENDYPFSPKK